MSNSSKSNEMGNRLKSLFSSDILKQNQKGKFIDRNSNTDVCSNKLNNRIKSKSFMNETTCLSPDIDVHVNKTLLGNFTSNNKEISAKRRKYDNSLKKYTTKGNNVVKKNSPTVGELVSKVKRNKKVEIIQNLKYCEPNIISASKIYLNHSKNNQKKN